MAEGSDTTLTTDPIAPADNLIAGIKSFAAGHGAAPFALALALALLPVPLLVALVLWMDRIEPERLFSFRWHPFAIDTSVDYSKESATLVTFELSAVEGGTLLTLTESGFDKLPLERRAGAFGANEAGWGHQAKLIEKYLAQYAQ